MPDRPETKPDAERPLVVTEFERERLDWQRRLYNAEDLAARLLREKNQIEQSLRQQIAQLESEVKTLREKLAEVAVRADSRPRSTSGLSRTAIESNDDPFGHVIRQAHRGKHTRLRQQFRQHALFILFVILTLALAAVLVWRGYRSRGFWQSSAIGKPSAARAASTPK